MRHAGLVFGRMNLPVGVTVTDFERAMNEIEPGIEGESLQAGVILLVAASRAEIGQDVDALAAFTGYDRDLSRRFVTAWCAPDWARWHHGGEREHRHRTTSTIDTWCMVR